MSGYIVEMFLFFWRLLSSGMGSIFSVLPTAAEVLQQIGFFAANLPLADQVYMCVTQVYLLVRELGLLWVMIYLWCMIMMVVILFLLFQLIGILDEAIRDQRTRAQAAQQARLQVERTASHSTGRYQRELQANRRSGIEVLQKLLEDTE
jgi:uncharacterized membrane protein